MLFSSAVYALQQCCLHASAKGVDVRCFATETFCFADASYCGRYNFNARRRLNIYPNVNYAETPLYLIKIRELF
jgi:hypothetical protein